MSANVLDLNRYLAMIAGMLNARRKWSGALLTVRPFRTPAGIPMGQPQACHPQKRDHLEA